MVSPGGKLKQWYTTSAHSQCLGAFLYWDVKYNCKYFEGFSPFRLVHSIWLSGCCTVSVFAVVCQCKGKKQMIMQNHFHPHSWLTITSPNRIYLSFKIYLHYPFPSQQIIYPFLPLWMTTTRLRVFLPEVEQGWWLRLAGSAQFARSNSLSLTDRAEMLCCNGCIFPLHWTIQPFSYDGGKKRNLQLRFFASVKSRSIHSCLKELTHLGINVR